MSDFKAKMHQTPQDELTELPQTPLLYLRGLLLRGQRERRRGRTMRKKEEEGEMTKMGGQGEGRERVGNGITGPMLNWFLRS